MTGPAAARMSGGIAHEAAGAAGGICSSYYPAPGAARRSGQARDDAYRFEIGGGHWIFGGDPVVLRWMFQGIADSIRDGLHGGAALRAD